MNSAGRQAGIDAPLLELAAQQATGCLVVTDDAGEEALVWLRDGDIYAVSVPGRRPLLGVRLVSSGVINPEALTEALEVQRTELRGWRLGELLVHLGYVDRPVIDDFVTEQMNDQLADLLGWPVRMSRFRNGERTRQDMTQPHNVPDLLDEARARRVRWAAVLDRVGDSASIPDLDSSASPATQSELGPHEWALLCKIDGARSLSDLADECGFTLFEAARLVADLREGGLVTVARRGQPGHDVETEAGAESALAKILQLHPAAPAPTAIEVAESTPAKFQPVSETSDPRHEESLARAVSAGWARMAEAANLLSEFASDTAPSDFLDTELLADTPEPSQEHTSVRIPTSVVAEFNELGPSAESPVAPEAPNGENQAIEQQPEPESEPESEPEPEPEPRNEDQDATDESAPESTDTASLLRELSSLGTVASDDSGPRLTSTSRSIGEPHSRKKRGFLGR
jgi:hypothetical protein